MYTHYLVKDVPARFQKKERKKGKQKTKIAKQDRLININILSIGK